MGEPTSRQEGHQLRLGPPARQLKRRLGPMAWAVLEDVALDAVPDDDGRLVATTSTRRIAENLGLGPGTAGRALSRLRQLGLVSLVRQSGDGGRFGLSAYVLNAIPGIEIAGAQLAPHGPDAPGGPPHPVQPCVVEPCVVEPCVADEHLEPPAPKAVARRRRRSAGAPAAGAQLSILDTAGGAEHETTESRRR